MALFTMRSQLTCSLSDKGIVTQNRGLYTVSVLDCGRITFEHAVQ